MYYVYILRLSDKSIYIGSAEDLKVRLINHNQGVVSSTKNFRPVELVFYSSFEDRIVALRFEKYLKTGSGFAFRKKHFGC